jgi:hypothetical protein
MHFLYWAANSMKDTEIFMYNVQTCGSSTDFFLEVPIIKFHEQPPSGNHDDTCEQTD